MRVEPVGLQDLFVSSDVVFILAATTSDKQGTIGASHFAAMRKGSIVVLVSRAGVVDFDALLDGAVRNHIRAAIDVFPQFSTLYHYPQFYLNLIRPLAKVKMFYLL